MNTTVSENSEGWRTYSPDDGSDRDRGEESINYDLHNHSSASDGAPIFCLAEAAKHSELDLIVVTDHEDYEHVEDIEGYISTIEEANSDFNDIEVVVGIEINYETNENDRYAIGERLEEEGLIPSFEKGSKYGEDDIEKEKREKAAIDGIIAPYGSVHDIDGVYIKEESDFLKKLHDDYLAEMWDSIEDVEEVDNEKVEDINRQVDVIKESFVDIYTEKVKKLAAEGEPYKFISHPDLPLRNSVLSPHFTEAHIDEMLAAFQESSSIPEANGKGMVRQFRDNFGRVIGDTSQLSNEEVVEKFGEVIRNERDNNSSNMTYFRKLNNRDMDFVVGSDSHRSVEIEVRNYYFELMNRAMDNQPLDLEELKRHLELTEAVKT